MIRPGGVFLFILAFTLSLSCNRRVSSFEVYASDYPYIDAPVFLELPPLENKDHYYLLYEVSSGNRQKLPIQLFEKDKGTYVFILEGRTEIGDRRKFVVKEVSSLPDFARIDFNETLEDISFYRSNARFFTYRKTEMYPPPGVDTLYKRSAYIHPLMTPAGFVLTEIQPTDHYHHYGIWNPWTKTHYQGREIDYWNLGKGQGTVRHKDLLDRSAGTVIASFLARHEHIDFGAGVEERVNIKEDWQAKCWNLPRDERYMLDLNSTFVNLLPDTILFDAYRYGGGLAYRATPEWNLNTCTVLTSEGLGRGMADGTKARWCIIEGESSAPEGRSGILFLSHPQNFSHPEPMRVWPGNNHQGELMFDYCPIRHEEWKIAPGKENHLQYRIVVFDGSITPREADMYWNSYAFPPQAVINK